ncbi:hypothetical protein [Novosphingobium resinovorum]|uniref:hypothetical protein n=1 Tax=Novosphingobium resinovorum TaxID=158500 RepID=UPI003D2AED91
MGYDDGHQIFPCEPRSDKCGAWRVRPAAAHPAPIGGDARGGAVAIAAEQGTQTFAGISLDHFGGSGFGLCRHRRLGLIDRLQARIAQQCFEDRPQFQFAETIFEFLVGEVVLAKPVEQILASMRIRTPV